LLYPANPLGDVPQLVFAFTQILAKLAGGFGLRGRSRLRRWRDVRGVVEAIPGEPEADIFHCSIDVHRFCAIRVRPDSPS
jgi:hypothetical protein